METALITIAAGRHQHLRRQADGIAGCVPAPDHRILVAMREEETESLAAIGNPGRSQVVQCAASDAGQLPLAAARNVGAEAAIATGAELLVFLDADCIPAPRLIERYIQGSRTNADALLCGPVGYLPPGAPPRSERGLRAMSRAHPARPVPADDRLAEGGDHRLFWSLSFAVTRETWHRIGGFDERYVGYGGEDTDFGQRAREAGVELIWTGGAWSFHQHHPVSDPPVEHLDAILANANRFHRRWGWWPMEGWLRRFKEMDLVSFGREGDLRASSGFSTVSHG